MTCVCYGLLPCDRLQAKQVLRVTVARQQECTGQVIALTKQRREVLGHPERLENLSRDQANPHVECIPRPTNRSNSQNIVQISNSYEQCSGPRLTSLAGRRRLENAAPPGRKETALTS